MLLHDLTFIEEGNPDLIEGRINFTKYSMVADIIDRLTQWQQASYLLEPVPSITNYFLSITALDDAELYSESLLREARSSNSSPVMSQTSKSKGRKTRRKTLFNVLRNDDDHDDVNEDEYALAESMGTVTPRGSKAPLAPADLFAAVSRDLRLILSPQASPAGSPQVSPRSREGTLGALDVALNNMETYRPELDDDSLGTPSNGSPVSHDSILRKGATPEPRSASPALSSSSSVGAHSIGDNSSIGSSSNSMDLNISISGGGGSIGSSAGSTLPSLPRLSVSIPKNAMRLKAEAMATTPRVARNKPLPTPLSPTSAEMRQPMMSLSAPGRSSASSDPNLSPEHEQQQPPPPLTAHMVTAIEEQVLDGAISRNSSASSWQEIQVEGLISRESSANNELARSPHSSPAASREPSMPLEIETTTSEVTTIVSATGTSSEPSHDPTAATPAQE